MTKITTDQLSALSVEFGTTLLTNAGRSTTNVELVEVEATSWTLTQTNVAAEGAVAEEGLSSFQVLVLHRRPEQKVADLSAMKKDTSKFNVQKTGVIKTDPYSMIKPSLT